MMMRSSSEFHGQLGVKGCIRIKLRPDNSDDKLAIIETVNAVVHH